MPLAKVNIGSGPNAPDADNLRVSFSKLNDNDEYLESLSSSNSQDLATEVATRAAETTALAATDVSLQNQINSRARKTGDTFTGDITVDKGTPTVWLNKTAGTAAQILAQQGGLLRWNLRLANASSESGGNAGSNLEIARYNDAGVAIDVALSILRSSGVASFTARPVFNGNTPWDAGNFNPANYAPLSGAIFTGSIVVRSSPAVGRVDLVSGDAISPGYLAFFNETQTRVGYIGYEPTSQRLGICSEAPFLGYNFNVRPQFNGVDPWDSVNLPATTAGKNFLNAADVNAQKAILGISSSTVIMAYGQDTTVQSTSSTSYIDAGLVVSITPRSVSNKVRGVVSLNVGASAVGIIGFTIYRNGSAITPAGVDSIATFRNPTSDATDCLWPMSFAFEDTPGVTTSVSYELRWRVNAGAAYLGRRGSSTDLHPVSSSMLLLEG